MVVGAVVMLVAVLMLGLSKSGSAEVTRRRWLEKMPNLGGTVF